MVCFRSAAPAFGALAGVLLLVTGCTTPPKPVATPETPSAIMGPDRTSTPAASSPAADIAPTPAPEGVSPAPSVPAPEPEPLPVVVAPEPVPVVVTKPAPATVAKPAFISGSEESSTMFDNFTAYVAAVDGRPVAAGRAGWNSPLALPAGPRRLTVTFIRGAFTAQTDVQLQARSAAIYQLKFATDAQIFGKSSYCEFSIVETATGENVLAATRVPLTKLETVK